MTSENIEDAEKEVDRIFELTNNKEKICIGTGHLPFETEKCLIQESKKCHQTKQNKAR